MGINFTSNELNSLVGANLDFSLTRDAKNKGETMFFANVSWVF